MPSPPFTREELLDLIAGLENITDGAVMRDTSTGWVGTVRLPADLTKITRGGKPPHKPMVALRGASPKEDREFELRMSFLDDLEPFDGEPVGFGKAGG